MIAGAGFGGNQIAEICVNFLGGPKPFSDFKGATAGVRRAT